MYAPPRGANFYPATQGSASKRLGAGFVIFLKHFLRSTFDVNHGQNAFEAGGLLLEHLELLWNDDLHLAVCTPHNGNPARTCLIQVKYS